MSIPDTVTIVRRNADGTTSERRVGGCSVDVPSPDRLQEFAESIGIRMTPWQVECVRTLLQGGQMVSGRQSGRTVAGRVAEAYLMREYQQNAAENARIGAIPIVTDPSVPPEASRRQTQDEIVAAFGVDPAVVGLTEQTDGTNTESDVLAAIDALERDEIDDLVDLQMRRERSGYDHNINQPKCVHCHDDAHSVPITERMQEMRGVFQRTIQYYEDGPRASDEVIAQLDAYRYNEDDSEIVCPGSEFIGPPRPPRWQLEQNRRAAERERRITEYLAGDPSYERLRSSVESGTYCGSEYALGCFYAGLPLPDAEDDTTEWTVTYPFGPFARPDYRRGLHALREGFAGVTDAFRQFGQQLNDAFSAAAWQEILLGPPRWYRYVDSDPVVAVELNIEREAAPDSWGRPALMNVRHRMTVTQHGLREEFELCTDPATGTCLVRRLTPDGRMEFDVCLRRQPTIGQWMPVEPGQSEEQESGPRNRRERRGHRDNSTPPMWAQTFDRRRRH